jgi:glycosyltransferase involved in cell wall biosynthesis
MCFEFMEVAYNVRGLGTLWLRHRRRRYDLVYERYAYLNLAGLITSRMAGVPFVFEVNFTSGTTLERERSRAARVMERWVERYVFRRADACVVVSSRLRVLLVDAGVDEAKVLIQPNAADPAKFDPHRRADALRASLGLEGKLIVGFVGHFSRWHGVRFLCDAFEEIRQQVPDVAYLLVGDGHTRAEIATMVRSRGWQDCVLLPGKIPHDSVPDYVALFDVAVMPDSNEYGSPMKIPEYMAAAKPVVAPRLWPIEDLLDDGRTGVLFEPGDGHELAAALVGLLSDAGRRKALGQAARREVEEVLNWDSAAERILMLAEKAVGPGDWYPRVAPEAGAGEPRS